MITMEEAYTAIFGQVNELTDEEVILSEALGRISSSQPVISPCALPPFRASIMDGYAIKYGQEVGEYPVAGKITAGVDPSFQLREGEVGID